MKMMIALVLPLVLVFGLINCSDSDQDYTSEPSISGIIKEIADTSILIESDMGDCWVSLNVKGKENSISFNIGDEVVVYYDGNIAESYPLQIHTVHAIILKTSDN